MALSSKITTRSGTPKTTHNDFNLFFFISLIKILKIRLPNSLRIISSHCRSLVSVYCHTASSNFPPFSLPTCFHLPPNSPSSTSPICTYFPMIYPSRFLFIRLHISFFSIIYSLDPNRSFTILNHYRPTHFPCIFYYYLPPPILLSYSEDS